MKEEETLFDDVTEVTFHEYVPAFMEDPLVDALTRVRGLRG